MCSFIIIRVSVIDTRFEFSDESVMLLTATRKPRLSASSCPAHTWDERSWRRGCPVAGPNT